MRLVALRPETDNYLTMDALRFLAAASVVIFHYRSGIDTPAVHDFLEGTFSRGYQFVDLFFVLSGFIIAAVYSSRVRTGRQIADFMIKRVARLWPLHLLLLVLYIGIWGASIVADVPLNEPEKYDASCIVPNILMIHSLPLCNNDNLTFNYVSWSISAEMFMYLLAPGLLLLGRRPLLLISCVAIVFVGLSLIPAEQSWQGWTYYWGVARALPAFAMGVALFHLRGRLAIRFPHLMTMVALLLFFALSWTEVPAWASLLVVYAVAIFAAAADAKADVPEWVRRVAHLSPLTYGLYMWHPITFTVGFSFIVKRLFSLSGVASDVMLLIVAVAAGAVAYLSLIFFEGPMRRLLARSATRPRLEASTNP